MQGYAGSMAVLILFIILFSITTFVFYGEEVSGIVFADFEKEELFSPQAVSDEIAEEKEKGFFESLPFIGGFISGVKNLFEGIGTFFGMLWSWISIGFSVVVTVFTFNIPSVPFLIRLIVVIPVWTLIIFILFDMVTRAIGSIAGSVLIKY